MDGCKTSCKISVIIPTYCPKSYIWECLDSVNNQTLEEKEYEVLIVLNGCKEPYLSEISDYIKNNLKNNTKLIHTNEGGVSHARNLGLEHSKGDYICFIDDDDYVSESYLAELLKYCPIDGVSISDYVSFDDESRNVCYFEEHHLTFSKLKNGAFYSLNDCRNYFGGPVAKLIPRSTIGDKLFDRRFKNGEDSLFMFYISDKIKKVCTTGADAIYYRRLRNNSATTTKKAFSHILHNRIKLCWEYTKIFFKNCGKYNVIFYLTRILGAIRVLLYELNYKLL
ncbi:glycosyltransferase family 2 protein [Bacteroides bouchesdurhonensis]